MKFGIRVPSLKRRISARTSLKSFVRHRMGLKVPRGYGFLTNPKKFAYNKVYNKTSFSFDNLFKTGKGSFIANTSSGGKGCLWVLLILLLVVFWQIGLIVGFVYLIFKITNKSKKEAIVVDESGNTENQTNL